MSTVTIKNVTKSYGSTVVLREFNEKFEEGEFVTLLGPSGCGKTTMLRMIAGFEIPSSGEIWIDDQLVSGGKTFIPPEQRNIGMVFQSYAVWPHMTVYDNVIYPLKIRKTAKEEIARRAEHILEIVHLSQYRDRMPDQLSGGQQQRVALARALLAEPKLLLLDEPLSNLDAKLRETMRFEIKELTKSLGISVVYVTHDQTEAMARSDRIFLINNGVVQQSGTPDEIYNHPENPFAADFLGKVDFFRGVSENGTIRITDWECSIPCPENIKNGPVLVAVRPENIMLQKKQEETVRKETDETAFPPVRGVLERMYYLGDVTDCRIRTGKALVRAVTDGFSFREFQEGEKITLRVRDFRVFEGDNAEEQLRILT